MLFCGVHVISAMNAHDKNAVDVFVTSFALFVGGLPMIFEQRHNPFG